MIAYPSVYKYKFLSGLAAQSPYHSQPHSAAEYECTTSRVRAEWPTRYHTIPHLKRTGTNAVDVTSRLSISSYYVICSIMSIYLIGVLTEAITAGQYRTLPYPIYHIPYPIYHIPLLLNPHIRIIRYPLCVHSHCPPLPFPCGIISDKKSTPLTEYMLLIS